MSALQTFVRDDRGATAIEYALIIALIAIVIIGAVTSVGPSVAGSLTRANSGFTASAS
jgi:pilus assembly protein Flp/PilA